LHLDADLLDQAVYTTECPNAIIGSFKPGYLEVPQEILITSMKEHQGFFSLINNDTGRLVAHFIAVANNQVKDMTLIREGNERVLAARLADAKFFFDEDRKIKLQDRVRKLAGVTFHQKLGTMAQKQERVATLAGTIAQMTGLKEPMVKMCHRAGELCKADLLTGIVGEFPTLQGVMGEYYAKFDGEDREVARAIGEQYKPNSMEGPVPTVLVSQALSLADRLDTLAAFFHVGIVPTGSEDPFALRRNATAIVRILLEGLVRLDLGQAVQEARAVVAAAGIKGAPTQGDAQKRLVDFLFERVRHYVKTVHGLRDDVIHAVLTVTDQQTFELRDLMAKMKALESVTTKPEFDPLIIGFKRAHRLVEKEQWDRKPVDPVRFEHATESALYQALNQEKMLSTLAISAKQWDYGQALDALVRLKPPIDAFFTAVMVNADDPAVRSNRLSLLQEVDDFFNSFADFSQIVVQGG
jgi:glycyl-tRNA synthetase beta chain